MPEPMVAPRPMAMSAGRLRTCFRRSLPGGTWSIGRTASICRSSEGRAPPPASLLFMALDMLFMTPWTAQRARPVSHTRASLGTRSHPRRAVLAWRARRDLSPPASRGEKLMPTPATPKGAPPAEGARIAIRNGKLAVPENPIIPFIEGDGTGPDIWRASVRVMDAAVAKAYGGQRG